MTATSGSLAVSPRNGTSVWWGEIATLAVVFLLCSNAPAVAVQFHGVPFIIGAMVVLFIPLTYYVILRREPLVGSPALGFILLFLIVGVVSAILSGNPRISQAKVIEECQAWCCSSWSATRFGRQPRCEG